MQAPGLRWRLVTAVKRVTHDRVPDCSQMHTQLMGAACQGLEQ
jgi:hypothetical protein